MNRLALATVLAAQLALISASPAQQTTSSTDAVISPIKKGQVAPFSGLLFSPRAAASVAVEIESIKEQVKLSAARAREEERAIRGRDVADVVAAAATDRKIAQAQMSEQVRMTAAIDEQLRREQASRSNSTFWYTVTAVAGVVIGVGLTALAAGAR